MYNKIRKKEMKNFRINLRNVAAIVACLAVMTACGGGSSNKNAAQSGDSGTAEAVAPKGGSEITEVNTENWQSYIKANFGIDVAVPDGWTLKKASGKKISDRVFSAEIRFTKTADNATPALTVGQTIFDASKAIAENGNYQSVYDTNTNEVKVIKFESFDKVEKTVDIWLWRYYVESIGVLEIGFGTDNSEIAVSFDIK
jgi:hypothetical protein